ncbi:hypothetical protein FHR33_007665 [Nonomuraea dietziae]|uniref:Uncharacterized protein n=1 Tax=Nonomuraea dietziae TaxID=65515 RepID=A0A7W5VGW8_9ACTN|nr:hypothetical protein [Nonomuraea dietziae]MBB3731805.1 hypothetical protein [Nonomuraea dietziae]
MTSMRSGTVFRNSPSTSSPASLSGRPWVTSPVITSGAPVTSASTRRWTASSTVRSGTRRDLAACSSSASSAGGTGSRSTSTRLSPSPPWPRRRGMRVSGASVTRSRQNSCDASEARAARSAATSSLKPTDGAVTGSGSWER